VGAQMKVAENSRGTTTKAEMGDWEWVVVGDWTTISWALTTETIWWWSTTVPIFWAIYARSTNPMTVRITP